MFDFEIKVALLGHVSVGKTTILNALFQEKFSEVSMKRTTAGINHFRVSRTKTKNNNHEDGITTTPAKATLNEIIMDNANLRNTTNRIEEKFFDIELDQHFIRNLRDDTCMVIVDIPGVNEAGTKKMYLDYVEKSWDTFDIIIVVMDAQQGVNTDEQVDLLNFVQNNLDFRKDMPVIVLCNKVDDPEDKDLSSLVEEAQREVERIFSVGDRTKALTALLDQNLDQESCSEAYMPAFLPLSAENAFLYRATSRLGRKEMKLLDKSYLNKIGREEVGKFQWKKLSENEQYDLVYDILSNPDQYEERLKSSNFDKFLSLLDLFVGGKEQQEKLLDKQLEILLRKLSFENGIVDQLHTIFVRSHAVGKDSLPIEDRFWELWRQQCQNAFQEFDKSPSHLVSLQLPMKELLSFEQGLHRLLHVGSNDGTKITQAMQGLVKKQINIILQKATQWDPNLFLDELKSSSYPHQFSTGVSPPLKRHTVKHRPFGTNSQSPFGLVPQTTGDKSNNPVGAMFPAAPAPVGFGARVAPVGGVDTNNAQFQPPSLDPDGEGKLKQMQSISAMQQYSTKSHEELRFEDYKRGNKGGGFPRGFGAPSPATGASFPVGTSAKISDTATAPYSFGTSPSIARSAGTATSTPFGSAAPPPNWEYLGKTLKERLLGFYQQYNPSKLNTVDQVLQKYQGNEEKLLYNLSKKYNIRPSFFGLPSSNKSFGDNVDFFTPKLVSSSLAQGAGAGGKRVFGVSCDASQTTLVKNPFYVAKSESRKKESNMSDEKVVGVKSANKEKGLAVKSWEKMSPKDWVTVFSSILLLTHRTAFAERFGQQITDIEWTLRTANFSKPKDDRQEEALKKFLEFMKGSYQDGDFVPVDQAKYDRAVQIKVPDSISDPYHWGHLAWLFCEFMDTRVPEAL